MIFPVAILEFIVRQIQSKPNLCRGLYQGEAGELLFLFLLQKYHPELVDDSYIQDIFSRVVNSVEDVLPDISFAEGATGIVWLLEFLLEQQPDLLCINNTYDDYLENLAKNKFWLGEHEITKGLAGISPYLKRRSVSAKTLKIANYIVSYYKDTAYWFSDDRCSWLTPEYSMFRLNRVNKDDEFNLGLAHGVPGIIAALLQLRSYKSGIDIKSLIVAGARWLIEQQKNPNYLGSYFSDTALSQVKSRLGWCYGDLSIALLLAQVGKEFHIPLFYRLGKQIADFSTRRDSKDALVNQATLCHGSSGVCLLFLLLSKVYADDSLKVCSDYWFNISMQHKALSGLNSSIIQDTGLLNGLSGIGLVILAKLYDETSWVDALFLK